MRFLTTKKACIELGITKVTLQYWEQQGIIKSICDRNNSKRYDMDSLASEQNNKRLSKIPVALDSYKPRWAKSKEAVSVLGVDRNTLLNWENAGKIIARRDKNNHRWFDLNSVTFG